MQPRFREGAVSFVLAVILSQHDDAESLDRRTFCPRQDDRVTQMPDDPVRSRWPALALGAIVARATGLRATAAGSATRPDVRARSLRAMPFHRSGQRQPAYDRTGVPD